jgi:hypothetical protein
MEKLIQLLTHLYQQTLGIFGPPTIITGTSPIPCQGTAFQVTSDCVIASITINGTAITSFSAITFSQGFILYGNITSVTLTSGSGMVYSGRNV